RSFDAEKSLNFGRDPATIGHVDRAGSSIRSAFGLPSPTNRIAKCLPGKGTLEIDSKETQRRPGMATLTAEQNAMVALFQRHVDAELAGDLDTAMATMTDNPHLNHVSSMAGGVGRDSVHAFY